MPDLFRHPLMFEVIPKGMAEQVRHDTGMPEQVRHDMHLSFSKTGYYFASLCALLFSKASF